MHQGANWDAYGPIDNSLCQCGNCDAGFAQRIITPCTLGYPATATGSNYRPPSTFNENEALYAFQVEGNMLEMFYSDEHALTLGVYQVTDTSGKVTNYPITPKPATPQCVQGTQLVTGTTIFDGTNQQSGIDGNGAASNCATDTTTFPCGRPLTPVLFITDITGNANAKTGDWQYGGTAYLPQKLCGLWKGAVKVVTGAASPVWAFSLTVDANPTPANVNAAKTGWNLGPGADPVPLNNVMAGAFVQAYGAEIAWNLDNLGLVPASRYRFQFIVHDGDQTRTGGDVGQACINVEPACPAGFTGANCDQCDLTPQPGDGSYTYFCFPTGITLNPYTLIKIPTIKLQTDPFYYRSGGFVPRIGGTDPQGYTVTCNCKRIVKTCPKACCGLGFCNQTNGLCDCRNVSAVLQPDPNTCCPTVPFTNVCYNDGNYCSGHGFCDGSGTCICSLGADGTPDWMGVACNISVPKQPSCQQLNAMTCADCQQGSQAAGIFCTWCTAYALDNSTGLTVGVCVDAAACQLNSNPSCTIILPVVIPPCPDQCSGHGTCLNQSNTNGQKPAVCKQNPNLAACNQTLPYLLTCVCRDGYSGDNCGAAPDSIVIISTLTTAAIIGIIIAIVVVIAAVGGGGFAIAQNMAAAPVSPAMNNPLYVGAGRSGHNPLHKA
jgi:hypothetical protein